jgi:pimeloyl-ACP methyl ester carboxylesterase
MMRQELAHAELRILDGAGHVVMYDRPSAFNKAVLSFFAGQSAIGHVQPRP